MPPRLRRAAPHAAAQLQVSSSCRRYPTLLERQSVVDRRQLTGKMKSTALEKNTTGSASPRRTIVLSLTTASSVILVLKETEAAKADALVGRFWALGQIRAWSWPRRVLDLDAPLT